MYATLKRNKLNNRDGDVGTIQQAGVIHYEHEWEFQQWSQAQRNIIELRRAVSRTKELKDIANWQTTEEINYTKYPHHVWMTTNSKTNNCKQSENYLKSAGKSC